MTYDEYDFFYLKINNNNNNHKITSFTNAQKECTFAEKKYEQKEFGWKLSQDYNFMAWLRINNDFFSSGYWRHNPFNRIWSFDHQMGNSHRDITTHG
jgi:hypothetical protein